MYGVNFNFASIKLPEFGPMEYCTTSTNELIIYFNKNTFAKLDISLYLKYPNDTEVFLTNSHGTSCTHAIDNNVVQAESIKLVVQGTTSLYTKVQEFFIYLDKSNYYTLPDTTLLCSETTLCNG